MNTEPLAFYTSKKKLIKFFFLSLLFVLGGWVLVSFVPEKKLWGWASIIFFGFCGMVILYLLCQKSKKMLEIVADGIRVFNYSLLHYEPNSCIYIPWYEIIETSIWVQEVQRAKLPWAMLRIRSEENLLNQQMDEGARRQLRRGLIRPNEFMLSVTSLSDISPEELKEIIDDRLQQYREQHPQ
ncbi:MAG: hypothetical protein IKP06_04455 [Elusimicrobiaceae bacterium]|nr:hypothetical protein [Elusimicrobiaceae bacterium]